MTGTGTAIELFNNDFLGLKVNDNKVVVSSRDVARVFEKEHKNVIRDIENLEFPEGFGRLNFEQTVYEDSIGRVYPEYLLTRDGFTLLAMGFTGSKAMQFKIKYIEAFNRMEETIRNTLSEADKIRLAANLPDFTNPAIAARAWAEQVEKNQLVSAERDEAIRTKSQISTRAQAQAMNTASHLSKKVHKLEEQLAIGTNFRTVKAIDWLPEYFDVSRSGFYSQVGKKLTEYCREEGYGIKEIDDPNYGTVHAFPKEAIECFHAKVVAEPLFLQKYRLY